MICRRMDTPKIKATNANTRGTNANHGLAMAMMIHKKTTANGKSIKVNKVLAV